MLKKETFFGFFIFSVVLLFGLSKDLNLLSHNSYSVSFFNVDLGDAILIKTPENKKIVIDGGAGDQLLPNLSKKLGFFEREIDLVILSHSDSDHSGGLVELLRRYKIGQLWLNQSGFSSPDFDEILKILKDKKINYKFVNEESDLAFDKDLFIDVLYPFSSYLVPEKVLNSNNASIVFQIEIGKERKKILFTGDIESDLEEILVQRVGSLKSDILKSPHHGSKTSSSTGFLSVVQASLVIFTADLENRFNHPHKEVVKRFQNLGIKTRQTGIENGVDLRFD